MPLGTSPLQDQLVHEGRGIACYIYSPHSPPSGPIGPGKEGAYTLLGSTVFFPEPIDPEREGIYSAHWIQLFQEGREFIPLTFCPLEPIGQERAAY